MATRKRGGTTQTRHPRRRCKRNRIVSIRRLNLLDVPDEVLQRILNFLVPSGHADHWVWWVGISQTCRVFRKVAHEFAPTEFVAKVFSPNLRIDFLKSFIDEPWKAHNIYTFKFVGNCCFCGNGGRVSRTIISLVRSLITMPRALPNLEKLIVGVSRRDGPIEVFDIQLLCKIARTHMRLNCISFDWCFRSAHVTPEQFASFARLLRKPLSGLAVRGVPWMSDQHVEAFLSYQGSHLIEILLEASCGARLSDLTANAIARHCTQLEFFMLSYSDITGPTLGPCLQANPKLKILVLDYPCAENMAGREFVNAIVDFAPNLEDIGAAHCQWLDDDGLYRIVQGQVESHGATNIPLHTLDIFETNVTPTGLRRVFRKAPGMLGERGGRISIGCSVEELHDPDYDEMPQQVNDHLADWRLLVQDFPNVRFGEPS